MAAGINSLNFFKKKGFHGATISKIMLLGINLIKIEKSL